MNIEKSTSKRWLHSSRDTTLVVILLLIGAGWAWRGALVAAESLETALVQSRASETKALRAERDLSTWRARLGQADGSPPTTLQQAGPDAMRWLNDLAQQHGVTLKKVTLGVGSGAERNFEVLSEPIPLSPRLRRLPVSIQASYVDYDGLLAFLKSIPQSMLPLAVSQIDIQRDELRLTLILYGVLDRA